MENWDSGQAYEAYVGRWSRQVAPEFLRFLALPPGLAWADIGCGTGALSAAILDQCAPAAVHGIDAAPDFVELAGRQLADPRARFERGNAIQLPWEADTYDAAVSGLVLNFVPDPAAMVGEMARITRSGGTVAVYVWDYAGGMQMMRHFWDAAGAVSPQAVGLDEGVRFPLCQPEPLRTLFEQAGLQSIGVSALDIPTVFQNFDDYWNPFLGGTGPAPTFLASISDHEREAIRQALMARLAPHGNGPIRLSARTWAVRGLV